MRRHAIMVTRRVIAVGSLSLLVGLVLTACATSPPAGVIAADARALKYGSSAPEVLNNPALRDKVRALFGPDWNPGGAVALGAPAYFPPTSSIRLVRVGDANFTALSGCVAEACTSHRGLLLIRQDGEQLLSRIDEGGYSHYYNFGTGAMIGAMPRPWIDAAWSVVEGIERG
jgi:hypothetical protein